jgi:F0F1-type ATP synthase epsilon subunit
LNINININANTKLSQIQHELAVYHRQVTFINQATNAMQLKMNDCKDNHIDLQHMSEFYHEQSDNSNLVKCINGGKVKIEKSPELVNQIAVVHDIDNDHIDDEVDSNQHELEHQHQHQRQHQIKRQIQLQMPKHGTIDSHEYKSPQKQNIHYGYEEVEENYSDCEIENDD